MVRGYGPASTAWTPVRRGRIGSRTRPSWLAQTVEHVTRWESVRGLPGRDLKVADGDAGARADAAIRVADIEAALAKELLQLTGSKGKYLVINVKPGISTTDLRAKGFQLRCRSS